MNIFKLISEIFRPAADLVDSLHTSEEEKLKQKAILLDLQTRFLQEGLEFEQEALKEKVKVVMAEAQSDSWLARNWRPMTMLALIVAVLAYWFGLTPPSIEEHAADSMFLLVQIGLGGYVIGRSGEKITRGVVQALKEKEKS